MHSTFKLCLKCNGNGLQGTSAGYMEDLSQTHSRGEITVSKYLDDSQNQTCKN